MWQRSCSRFKQRGHPGYTTCIWATRTPQCIALKITLGWETVPAGGNGACLSGRDKKARQRLRLILINETWVSRCRKDLDVIFVKVSVSGQKISFYSRSVGLKGKCACVCVARDNTVITFLLGCWCVKLLIVQQTFIKELSNSYDLFNNIRICLPFLLDLIFFPRSKVCERASFIWDVF